MNYCENGCVTAKDDFPLVSVVINYYNEIENVEMAPLSLSKQTYRNFEVVLVDDGSTDGTTENILEKYDNTLVFDVVKLPRPLGLRPARSLGVKHARGNIIVTLDLHTQFDKLFLEKIVAAFEKNPRIGACGCLVLGTGNRWFNSGARAFEKFSFALRASSQSYKYFFGCAAAFRSETFDLIGSLSEDEVPEDADFAWRMGDAGLDILLLNDVVVFHKESEEFSGLVRTLFVGGLRAAPALLKHKHKLLYPQNFVRFLVLPALLVLILFLKPELLLLLLPSSLVLLTIVFALKKNSFEDAFYGSLVAALFILLTTVGFYYGLILVLLKRLKIVKRFNADVKPQKFGAIEEPAEPTAS